MRNIRYKEVHCQWSVSGHEELVHAFVFEVEGYGQPWFVVTTALDLSAESRTHSNANAAGLVYLAKRMGAGVEAFAARYRQKEGFRDHKQRLGMEECRAWTKEPALRTFQVSRTHSNANASGLVHLAKRMGAGVAMTLLRLMQFRLNATWGEGSYWLKPEWNRRKVHPSILDLRRLFWRYRPRFSKLLLRLEEIEKIPRAAIPARQRADRAA